MVQSGPLGYVWFNGLLALTDTPSPPISPLNWGFTVVGIIISFFKERWNQ